MISGDIQLLHPEWFWLLPVLAVLFIFWKRAGRYDEHTGLSAITPWSSLRFKHPLIPLIPRNAVTARPSKTHSILTLLAIVCLTIALAEPVRTGKRLPDPPEERDIVFIVDTSVSMVLRDYILDGKRIDRMSLLKGLLDRFVQQLRGERISIIVFGDAAYTLVPLTRDQSLIRRMLSRIETTIAGRASVVGEGIALAIKEAGEQSGRRRVLVLLTDAALPIGDITPQTAAELAAREKLPLYTIAIGAGSFAAEEQRNAGLIYQPADLELLQSLADRTGARSYQAGSSETLQQAIADIERREKNPGAAQPRYYRQPLYAWPLVLGLMILSLSQLSRLLAGNRMSDGRV